MAVYPLWKAVHSLREAEALAGLGNVAGPLDGPPEKPEDEDSWARDWLARARAAFNRASEMHEEAKRKGIEVLQQRARLIVERLRDGAAAVRAGAKNIVQTTREELGKFHETVQSAAVGWATMNVLFLVAGLIAAAWYFTRK